MQVLDDEADAEERDDLASQLHNVLLGLDSEGVMAAAAQEAGDSHSSSTSRSDPFLVGVLAISLANPRLLTAVVEAVKTWLAGRKCSVEIRIDQDRLTLEGGSPRSQEWTIRQFLARYTAHSPD